MALEVTGITAGYGPITVLDAVSFSAGTGEIVAILGANGAGKSTLLKSIVGLIRPTSGAITLDGLDITGKPVEAIVRDGLTLVPEGRLILGTLTVVENLRMGAFSRTDRRAVAEDVERMLERFPRLAERRKHLGSHLSGGEQQMLAIARALMSRPQTLLLDEPSLGLAPVMADSVFDLIEELRAQDGLSIVLVEQSISHALAIADRAYVMQQGAFTAQGTTAEISAIAQELEASYLGGVA